MVDAVEVIKKKMRTNKKVTVTCNSTPTFFGSLRYLNPLGPKAIKIKNIDSQDSETCQSKPIVAF